MSTAVKLASLSLGVGLGVSLRPLVAWLRARRRAWRARLPAQPPSADLAEALVLDASDELAPLHEHFAMPEGVNVYLCGHSLGLMPASAAALVREELELWQTLGERGHFTGPHWLSYHERVRAPLARLVGASDLEVVAMNSLTVNLHLLMASFYAPTKERYKIVIEAGAFPSDRIAVRSHAALRGYGGDEAIIELRPSEGCETLTTAEVLAFIAARGDEVALLLLSGVQYYTGQRFEMGPISAAGRAAGCVVGWDLAHAVGNVPLRLHEWGVDFAAWCSYKYLNGEHAEPCGRCSSRLLAACSPLLLPCTAVLAGALTCLYLRSPPALRPPSPCAPGASCALSRARVDRRRVRPLAPLRARRGRRPARARAAGGLVGQ